MIVEDILFYLVFAKTKLSKDCIEHQKANIKINELIQKIQKNQDVIEEILQKGD